jgi:hypothetical protein
VVIGKKYRLVFFLLLNIDHNQVLLEQDSNYPKHPIMKTTLRSGLFFIFLNLPVIGSSQIPVTMVLQPDSALGKDANIHLLNLPPTGEDNNWGGSPDFATGAWTWSGNPGVIRSLIQFDLSSIPLAAVITDARLSLYNNPTSSFFFGQHSSLSGSNESVLQRITAPWDEFSVTWNNQPPTTMLNEVILPQSTSAHEDYLNIDVTTQVNDMFLNPSSNFGFMIRLQTELYYRSMIFASSDNADASLHPKLEITYLLHASTSLDENMNTSAFYVYQNLSTGIFSIHLPYEMFNPSIKMSNSLGEEIYSGTFPNTTNKIDIELNIAPGVYFIQLNHEGRLFTKKFFIQ